MKLLTEQLLTGRITPSDALSQALFLPLPEDVLQFLKVLESKEASKQAAIKAVEDKNKKNQKHIDYAIDKIGIVLESLEDIEL